MSLKLKIVILIILLAILSSCSTKKRINRTKEKEVKIVTDRGLTETSFSYEKGLLRYTVITFEPTVDSVGSTIGSVVVKKQIFEQVEEKGDVVVSEQKDVVTEITSESSTVDKDIKKSFNFWGVILVLSMFGGFILLVKGVLKVPKFSIF
jgi:hypothetical protein